MTETEYVYENLAELKHFKLFQLKQLLNYLRAERNCSFEVGVSDSLLVLFASNSYWTIQQKIKTNSMSIFIEIRANKLVFDC